MISVGPLLGIESDYQYTVLVCFEKTRNVSDIKLLVTINGKLRSFAASHKEPLYNHQVLRFEFSVPNLDQSYEVHYELHDGKGQVSNGPGESKWTFVVPGNSQVPKIGFTSCNGNDKKLPEAMDDAEFVMWEKLYSDHTFQELDYSIHCLLLSGDQVYADPIWDTIPYFKNNNLLGWTSSRKFADHHIAPADLEAFIEALECFYENLYIQCWSKPSVAKVLASIPTIMMWDDHDIFDGWGSYSNDLQSCEIFQRVCSIAKKYFVIFQIRTKHNQSLLSDHSFSQRLSFRNYEILSLDNRSHRNQQQIMSVHQYEELEALNKSDLFDACPANLQDERVLLFAIPVPIAHLDYKKRVEWFLPWLFRYNFRSSLNDDGLDHWDHSNHHDEHRKLIDLIFKMGEDNKAKYVNVVSGDVHSAGAGLIARERAPVRYVNQMVSSAIVYHPISRIFQRFIDWASSEVSDVSGYEVKVSRFGIDDTGPANIYERNFGYLYKAEGRGLKFYLTLENNQDDYVTLENGEKRYKWHQPRKFDPAS